MKYKITICSYTEIKGMRYAIGVLANYTFNMSPKTQEEADQIEIDISLLQRKYPKDHYLWQHEIID